MSRVQTGRIGERRVIHYLEANGYQVLETNFRFHHKEVDIIARKDDIIVFVEVKTRNSERFGSGMDSIGGRKIKNVVSVARYYIEKHMLSDCNVRFDAASIDDEQLNYVENAFHP